mmetsp:Transcript_32222/g.49289  ORF Transcript_32222/g.49289 Transcript_32222/m.49289 type:complete len:252 (+) Transcript_32222:96-851(+)
MTCVACSSAIEKGLLSEFKGKGLLNEKSVNVMLLVHKLRITFKKQLASDHNITPETIINEVEDLGFGARLLHKFEQEEGHETERQGASDIREMEFVIKGMTCSSCSSAIERHFTKGGDQESAFPGVESASVSLLTHKATIKFDYGRLKPRQIVEEIEDLGFEAEVFSQATQDVNEIVQAEVAHYRKRMVRCLLWYLPVLFLVWVVPYVSWTKPLMLKVIVWNGNSVYVLLMMGISTYYLLSIGLGYFRSAF